MAPPQSPASWNQCLLRIMLMGCTDGDQSNFHPSFGVSNGQPQAMAQTNEFLSSELDQSEELDDLLQHAGSEITEDPVMIDRLLADFEKEVKRGRNSIYEKALDQDRSYMEDPAFRLKFLRANMHDVRKAVQQMISFLTHKAKYFGADKVASDITVDDMTPEELKIMLSGLYHVQADADRNGRVILHRFNRFMPGKFSAETMIRVNYYIWFNILAPMHSVQKKGVLAIFYDISKPGTHSLPEMKSILQVDDFMSCLPMRYSGIHVCLKQVEGNLPLRQALLGFAVRDIPKDALKRSKVHYGSDVELQYQLSRYGVPLDTFPVDKHGNPREGILNMWIHDHLKNYENISNDGSSSSQDDDDGGTMSASHHDDETATTSAAPKNTVVDGIWETDVLLGRGRLVQYHPGNIRFREFLDERIQGYETLPRNQRRKACADFTRELLAGGTRFLRQTETGIWAASTFEETVDKVAQYYRTRRRIVR